MDSSTVVFADTNLDTHLAVEVSPDITAGNFKRDLESLHSKYFPEIGNIRIHKLMVKRRSCFYHLPDTLPIKHAFHGMKGTWFISLEAYPIESYEHKVAKCVAEEVRDHVSDNNVTGAERKDTKWKRRKRKRKRFYRLKFVLKVLFRSVNLPNKTKRRKVLAERLERKENVNVEERTYPCSLVASPSQMLSEPVSVNLSKKTKRSEMLAKRLQRKESVYVGEWTRHCSSVAAPSQTLSETVSVSDIIEKYFSGYDEVTSRSLGQFKSRTDVRCLNIKVDRVPKCAEKTLPAMIYLPFPANGRSGPSGDNLGRGKVGKSLVLASDSLGISASKQKPTVSLCRFSERNASNNLFLNSSTLVRNLVFEINDADD